MDVIAYINPQPGFSEAEQKALLAPLNPRAYYVQGRNEDRTDAVRSLRANSVIAVGKLYALAKAAGRRDTRYADLLEATDAIHGRFGAVLDASTGKRTDSKKDWPTMRDEARAMLGKAVKVAKDGRPRFTYTDAEWKDLVAVADSKRLKNWSERRAAIKRRGIKPPGRTWFYNNVVSRLDA